MLTDKAKAELSGLHEHLSIEKHGPYLGTRAFYSPYRENPKYLLIGLNPGSDCFREYEKDNGQKLCDLGEMSKGLHYMAYGCQLGDSIVEIFKAGGKEEDLEVNTVKTNCYFQGTFSSKELWDIFDEMHTYAQKQGFADYRSMQSEILLDLIAAINPQYIISEGVRAFGELNQLIKLNPQSKQLAPSRPHQEFSILAEEKYLLPNMASEVTIVEFPRNHWHGIEKKWRPACAQWLRNH